MDEKIDGYTNDPENSSTTKVSKCIPSDFPMPTILSFESIKDNHHAYGSKGCWKKFFKSLREHTMEIINFKKQKMLLKFLLLVQKVIN